MGIVRDCRSSLRSRRLRTVAADPPCRQTSSRPSTAAAVVVDLPAPASVLPPLVEPLRPPRCRLAGRDAMPAALVDPASDAPPCAWSSSASASCPRQRRRLAPTAPARRRSRPARLSGAQCHATTSTASPDIRRDAHALGERQAGRRRALAPPGRRRRCRRAAGAGTAASWAAPDGERGRPASRARVTAGRRRARAAAPTGPARRQTSSRTSTAAAVVVELPAPLAAVEGLVDLVGIQLRAPPCRSRRRVRRALRDFRRRPAAVRGRRRAALTKCGLDCLGQLRHRATGRYPIAARTLSQMGFGDGAAVRRRSR